MKKLYLLLFFFLFSLLHSQNPAEIDLSYDYNDHDLILDGNVTTSITLSDGKVILVGEFTGYRTGNSVVIKTGSIIRLNSDLSYDSTFDIGKKLVGPIYSVALQSTGKIVVAGSFTSYNGTEIDRSLLRFNADGSLDTTFKSTEAKYSGIKQVKTGPDNKIYTVAGSRISRLTANGDPDSFSRSYGNSAIAFAVDKDGKMVIGAYDYDGQQAFKINPTGYPVSGYEPGFNYFDCGINSVDIQSDGKILVGGSFRSYGSKYTSYVSVNYLVRINLDGSLDTSFSCPELIGEYLGYCANAKVTVVLAQPDNKILVGGIFPPYKGAPSRNLIRLNSDGTIDNTFVTGTGTNAGINAISLRPNGNILVCASNVINGSYINLLVYNSYDIKTFFELDSKGKLVNREKSSTINAEKILQRPDGKFNIIGESRAPYHRGLKTINNDGSLAINTNLFGAFDNEPVGSSGPTEATSCLDGVIQPDGKMILVGDFHTYNDVLADGLVRLNSDYTLDTSFNIGKSFTFSDGDAAIRSVALQPDGKILVGGYFDTFRGIPTKSKVIRLNSNGELDSTFSTTTNIGSGPTQIEVQPDGKILINVSGLFRLNSDGTIDTSFNPQAGPSLFAKFALLPDGKILVPDDNRIKRMHSNGSIDTSFNSGEFDNAVSNSFAIQADGKILCAGRFNHFDNVSTRGLLRLNADGTLDPGFNIGTGFNAKVESVFIEADGKILVTGSFTNYNGAWCNGSVRLLGGDAFVVNGQSKIDYTNNGCDVNDIVFPNLKFDIAANSVNSVFISNNTGNYSIPLPSGKHTITPKLENPEYFNIQPKSISANFPSQASPLITNFCFTPNGIHPDLEISFIPINSAVPGFISKYKILYKNKGNQIQSGSVNFTFDDSILDVLLTSPTTTSKTTGNLKWNFTNLSPLETREILLNIRVNKPTDTPPANGGTILKYTAEITSSSTDEAPKDNTFNFDHVVVNSFDPNDKTCLEGAIVQSSKIGDYVHYVIRFENSGTYKAQNVTVRDVIDTNKFDITTLIPQTGSHLFTTKIADGNKVEFLFEGIDLPFDDANNDGYVSFKIKTKSTLKAGDEFSNSSSIYFDYNSAIVTNTATTKIEGTLSNPNFSTTSNFIIYPNPVHDILFISKKQDQEIKSLNVYNTLGQIILSYPNANALSQINVSNLPSGSYFIKIKSDNGVSNSTFIKK
ncbi:DUF7619 domain-containing protein [Flavobacterium piscisymbiosum]|uniref:T9SS type A sorting domain-containing protein n=1 Tax=Flavobacterium piscisymbiosum TaxID=2893753 RepID=A0ABS8MAW7_9FLAO|nr:T9SS type A sorting domain-containing protein [Flavobacterium sp. F-30]MCC9061865.1 T9SS type A sorting domain-containing protein [Flavobacterium sp. F-30]